MSVEAIEEKLKAALTLDELHVSGEGSHFQIIAVGEIFADISRVKRQQVVYAPLKDLIADGSVHAVSIKTFTPDQWQRDKKLLMPS